METEKVAGLIAMLECVVVEDGISIFDHTPEELGQEVADNHAAVLAALRLSAEARSAGRGGVGEDALREALQEAIDVLAGMCDDEIDEELLPRLQAALSPQPTATEETAP